MNALATEARNFYQELNSIPDKYDEPYRTKMKRALLVAKGGALLVLGTIAITVPAQLVAGAFDSRLAERIDDARFISGAVGLGAMALATVGIGIAGRQSGGPQGRES